MLKESIDKQEHFVEADRPTNFGSWVLKHRFVKFGIVGFSGIFVNLGVLYVAQEYLFLAITSPGLRLNLSLATAIFVATLNNFIWNRAWTWGDRRPDIQTHVILQFIQYCAACWLAIIMQFVLTNFLATFMHYMLANLTAIGISAFLNYIINHIWTFRTSASASKDVDCRL